MKVQARVFAGQGFQIGRLIGSVFTGLLGNQIVRLQNRDHTVRIRAALVVPVRQGNPEGVDAFLESIVPVVLAAAPQMLNVHVGFQKDRLGNRDTSSNCSKYFSTTFKW